MIGNIIVGVIALRQRQQQMNKLPEENSTSLSLVFKMEPLYSVKCHVLLSSQNVRRH